MRANFETEYCSVDENFCYPPLGFYVIILEFSNLGLIGFYISNSATL